MALHCIEIPRMAAFFKCSRLFSFIAYLLLCPTFELPHCFSLFLRENSPFLPATRNFSNYISIAILKLIDKKIIEVNKLRKKTFVFKLMQMLTWILFFPADRFTSIGCWMVSGNWRLPHYQQD